MSNKRRKIMFTRRLGVLLVTFSAMVLIVGSAVVACRQDSHENDELHTHEDDELQSIAGDVTVVLGPPVVRLESKNQIYFSVSVSNSGSLPISAWALDLGDDLYLVQAEPKEQMYHKGSLLGHEDDDHEHNGHEDDDEEHGHGNVLLYGIPIEPDDKLLVELILGVLFDIEGKFDPNPELRLFYARGTIHDEILDTEDLHRFEDTFLSYPFVEANLHIER